jgi:glycosyltransferase involved in cell wall biosynthesis
MRTRQQDPSTNPDARAVVIVAHKWVTQQDDEMVVYLNRQHARKVLHIRHSFSDAPDRRSFCSLYVNGELAQREQSADYRGWPEPLIYAKEMFFTLKWAVRHGKWDLYVGMDGLCMFWGNLLRALNVVNRTIFWVVDFVPRNRFEGRLKNHIYRVVNRIAYSHADEIWDCSPRMLKARQELGGIEPSSYRSHRVVQYGVWLDRIPHFAYAQCDQNTLVFMGHLLEKQGVQLVIRALPAILERLPGLRFKIIGGGSFEPVLQALAKEVGVADHCIFVGRVRDIERLELEVARSAVAIAPYIRALDTYSVYGDSGKVKTYLACGLPVLLTDVPWLAADIEQRGCGKLISEDLADIANKVVAAMEPEANQRMRTKARQFARTFDWPGIFGAALGGEAQPADARR